MTNGTWTRWCLTIAGVKHWLWRAVDQNGMVLQSYAGTWVTAWSGGALCWRVDDLDAVGEGDALDDLGQLVFALQPSPAFRRARLGTPPISSTERSSGGCTSIMAGPATAGNLVRPKGGACRLAGDAGLHVHRATWHVTRSTAASGRLAALHRFVGWQLRHALDYEVWDERGLSSQTMLLFAYRNDHRLARGERGLDRLAASVDAHRDVRASPLDTVSSR